MPYLGGGQTIDHFRDEYDKNQHQEHCGTDIVSHFDICLSADISELLLFHTEVSPSR